MSEANWPTISVVTPSFNQGEYLDACIRSVLDQAYPRLEYFVLDGGSTDASRAVIERHASRLSGWRCEPDAGQAAAIAEGFARASGEILAWINADDLLEPGALRRVAEAWRAVPDAVAWTGEVLRVDARGEPLGAWRGLTRGARELLLLGNSIPQQGTFMNARAVARAGGVDAGLRYVMDFDLWVRLSMQGAWARIDGPALARFRYHGESKSVSQSGAFFDELERTVFARPPATELLSGDELELARARNALRRLHEEIQSGDTEAARRSLDRALAARRWPWGDAEQTARRIVDYQGLAGHRLDAAGVEAALEVVAPSTAWPAAVAPLRRAIRLRHALRRAADAAASGRRLQALGAIVVTLILSPRRMLDRSVMRRLVWALTGLGSP
ncbi:MAG: glycosyltransferase [Chromatiales bacterium]|nr:glycosyltransferase [Chromatiales bacterium]